MTERIVPEPEDKVMDPAYWEGHNPADGCPKDSPVAMVRKLWSNTMAAAEIERFLRRLNRAGVDRFAIVDSINPDAFNEGTIVLIWRETLRAQGRKFDYAEKDLYWGVVMGRKEKEHSVTAYPYIKMNRADTYIHNVITFERSISVGDVEHAIHPGDLASFPYPSQTFSRIKGLQLCKIAPMKGRRFNIRLLQGLGKPKYA